MIYMEIYNGTHCVYVHTNKANGKMYVGQTKLDVLKRWDHGRGYKTCTLFCRAIEKYGWDNFEHEIIASGLTSEEADTFEKILIDKLNTTNPECGYNLRTGGNLNSQHSESTKQKISESHKGALNPMYGKVGVLNPNYGKPLSEETKRKLSEANKGKFAGEKNPCYGKHPSDEARKKMSKSHIGLYAGEKHPNAKAILQFTLDGVFMRKWNYLSEAANEFNVSPSCISLCCSGTNKSSKGYIWLFEDDADSIDHRVALCQQHRQRKEPIVQLDINGNFVSEWVSAAEAGRHFNITGDNISFVCRGKGETSCGFKWMYAKEYYAKFNNN